MPDAQEQHQRRHRRDRGDDVHQPRAVQVGDEELQHANGTPATRIAGQMPTMPRHPANAAISQNGTSTEKSGSCRPTMPLKREQVEPADRTERDDRRAERAERHRRRVGDEREARRRQRREAEADEQRAGDRDRRAEAGRALEERAEGERHEQQLQPRVRRDVRDALAQRREQPALVGELVQEDDVQDDPADRQQAEGRAVGGARERHRRRHAEHGDGHHQRRAEADERGRVRAQLQERERAEQRDDRQRRAHVDSHGWPSGS